MCDINLDRIKLGEIGEKITGSYILYENDEGDCVPLYVENPERGWSDSLEAIEQKIIELEKSKYGLSTSEIDSIDIRRKIVGKYLIFIRIRIFRKREPQTTTSRSF